MATVDAVGGGGGRNVASGGGAQPGGGLGLGAASALVMGSIIGTGVFLLPASLAAFGTISLVAFVFTAIGAIALAQMFGVLSKRMPADGGPYAYSRAAFGNVVGFFNAWSYWITAWAGNAAIVVAWVVYVEVFVNTAHDKAISILIGFVGLWVPAVINLSGVKNMASVQIVTTIIKFIPLVIISTVGLFYIDWDLLTSTWNISGKGPLPAIVTCMALAVFSYLGVETASVAAGKVRNPRRNVPLASLLGTLACTVVYLLSTLVIFGTVSNAALTADGAQPFTLAFNAMFGGTWAGYAVAVAAIISGLTAAVPYLFSALALTKWSFKADDRTPGANWKFDGAVAIVGVLFSALIIYGSFTDSSTAMSLLILSAVVFLLGLALYFYMRRRFTDTMQSPMSG